MVVLCFSGDYQFGPSCRTSEDCEIGDTCYTDGVCGPTERACGPSRNGFLKGRGGKSLPKDWCYCGCTRKDAVFCMCPCDSGISG